MGQWPGIPYGNLDSEVPGSKQDESPCSGAQEGNIFSRFWDRQVRHASEVRNSVRIKAGIDLGLNAKFKLGPAVDAKLGGSLYYVYSDVNFNGDLRGVTGVDGKLGSLKLFNVIEGEASLGAYQLIADNGQITKSFSPSRLDYSINRNGISVNPHSISAEIGALVKLGVNVDYGRIGRSVIDNLLGLGDGCNK